MSTLGLAAENDDLRLIYRPETERGDGSLFGRLCVRCPHRPEILAACRFPPPWTVEEYRGLAYIVRDANRFPVAPPRPRIP